MFFAMRMCMAAVRSWAWWRMVLWGPQAPRALLLPMQEAHSRRLGAVPPRSYFTAAFGPGGSESVSLCFARAHLCAPARGSLRASTGALLSLAISHPSPEAKANLVALEKQSYAVLRTGVESEIGKSFPESLVVFPQHKPAQIHQSGACRRSLAVAAAVLSAIAMW